MALQRRKTDALGHLVVAVVDIWCSFELAVVFARAPFASPIGVRAPQGDGPTLPIHDTSKALPPLNALNQKSMAVLRQKQAKTAKEPVLVKTFHRPWASCWSPQRWLITISATPLMPNSWSFFSKF